MPVIDIYRIKVQHSEPPLDSRTSQKTFSLPPSSGVELVDDVAGGQAGRAPNPGYLGRGDVELR